MTIRGRLVSFLALFVMALPVSSGDVGDREHKQFLSLEMLDRHLIVENRVRVATIAISQVNSDQVADSGSCLVESFEFDRVGSLVLHSPPLVSSDYYYLYSENRKLVGFRTCRF